MKEISYKVALQHIDNKNFSEKRKAVLRMLQDIKDKKIKDKKEFIILLKSAAITDMDVIKIIQNEINEDKSIIDFILYLGESPKGIGFIPNSWFARNLEDKSILKGIPKNYWNLLRDTKWIKENTL